ncbi:MAG: exonuclease domain-containing protein [Myxococcales bacterium]|jgi:DNA polymerase-3 subunit epsilon
MDLVFVDVETTGLDPERHELIEVAAVRVHPHTLEPIDHASVRIRPGSLADADPRALVVNGYTDEAWRDAVTLQAALRQVSPLLEGAVVAGHNVGFDWAFLSRGFARAGLPLPAVDYHRVDTASLAWPLLAGAEIDSLSLDAVCAALGLSRPTPHRALADALASLEVARRLRDRSLLGRRVAGLVADERPIVEALLDRIEGGRADYGPWEVDDGRDYRAEAFAEVIDGLHYCAAELVRLSGPRVPRVRRRRVYVCHPYRDDPQGNAARVAEVCRALTDSGLVPIAPQLYLPAFVDEATQREEALALCLELLDVCDEVRVYGERVSEGMRVELRHAEARRIPIRFAAAGDEP